VAHVANATPNHPIPVELPAVANASIETRQLSVTVSERQNVSLGVTTRTERDENRTPEFSPGAAAEGVGYISVDHTVPDEDIETVSFRFTVAADRITPEERGDIALYRHHNGSWNEVPTSYVDRNGTAYVFEAESPGLSEFTVGKKVPAFEIEQATLLASPQTVADPVDVRVRITNDGGADGVYTARLLLNQAPIAEKQLSIAAGGTRQTSFEQDIDAPGEYTVLVNNYTVGDLDVNPSAVEAGDGSNGSESIEATIEGMSETIEESPSTMTEMPGFGIVAGTMALLVAGLLRRRRIA
jgi:PGF-pre-PGF domain-containing protein